MATTTTTAATSPPSSNILAPIPLNLVPNHTTSTSLSTASLDNHPFKKRKVSHSENVNVHNDVFAVSESPQTISIRVCISPPSTVYVDDIANSALMIVPFRIPRRRPRPLPPPHTHHYPLPQCYSLFVDRFRAARTQEPKPRSFGVV